MAGMTPATRRQRRRRALREALAADPLLTDAALALRLQVSVPTVRLDRVALGIPEVRRRVRAMAERGLARPGGGVVRGAIVDLEPGSRAVAVLEPRGYQDPDWFADAQELALAASGVSAAAVDLVQVRFRRAELAGPLVAKAEVLRRRRDPAGGRERRVVLVQIRVGDQVVVRAKFVVAGGAAAREA